MFCWEPRNDRRFGVSNACQTGASLSCDTGKPGATEHLCRRREPPDSDLVVSKPRGRHMDSQREHHLKRAFRMRFKRCLLIFPLNMPRFSMRISKSLFRPPGFAVCKIGLRRLTPPAEMCRPPGCFTAQHLSGTSRHSTSIGDSVALGARKAATKDP